MEGLTQEQKNSLKNIEDFLQKSEVSQFLPIFDELKQLNQNLKAIADKEMPKMEVPSIQKVEIVGLLGGTLKGDNGEDGKDYILTENDKKEIADSIKVPVVEKIIEKTEVIKEQPIITQEITNEIKEVAVKDTPEELRDKLETLKEDERLDISAIKGLDQKLNENFNSLSKKIDAIPRPTGGARANNATKFYPLTADGVNKVFNVPKSVAAIVLCSDFPNVLMENNGFTVNATRTQITLTTDNAPSFGAQLLYQYTSVFNT